MRIGEIVLIVALVAGMVLVLAFGFGKGNTGDDIGAGVAVTPEGGTTSQLEAEAANAASGDTPENVVFVDFNKDGEYILVGGSVKNTGNSLSIFDVAGIQVGSFEIDAAGKMVPTSTQPNDNVVKSAYSGPPGDSYSKYTIYPASYRNDKSIQPLIAVENSNGSVSIAIGDDLDRKRAKSYKNTFGTTGSDVATGRPSGPRSGGRPPGH